MLGVDLMEFGVPEAMWHLRVKNFAAIVTMDAHGNSLHAPKPQTPNPKPQTPNPFSESESRIYSNGKERYNQMYQAKFFKSAPLSTMAQAMTEASHDLPLKKINLTAEVVDIFAILTLQQTYSNTGQSNRRGVSLPRDGPVLHHQLPS